jgi:hypothetical protein
VTYQQGNGEDIPTEFSRAHVVIGDDDPSNAFFCARVRKLAGIIDEAEDGVARLN